MARILLFLVFVGLVSGPSARAQERIRLATTTSTENSGLLAQLIPPFERRYGITVDVVAVGTGRALKLGERGDVDLVLVHARVAEDRFVESGYGVDRHDVMYNDFVILGPIQDNVGIGGFKNAPAALSAVAAAGHPFISRGDGSGTHKKEMALWAKAGVKPRGKWYKEIGQGMSAAIIMAFEIQAYTISDRGTFLALAEKIRLAVLVEGAPDLYNPYGVIAVNPALYKHVNYKGALQFIEWLTSDQGQEIIGNFQINGQNLFYPSAVR